MAWVVTAVAAAFEVGASAIVISTAIAEVGTAMSIVGAVTGSKDLMKIGGVLGIAGGVGTMAAGGMFGQGAADVMGQNVGDATAQAAYGSANAAGGDALSQAGLDQLDQAAAKTAIPDAAGASLMGGTPTAGAPGAIPAPGSLGSGTSPIGGIDGTASVTAPATPTVGQGATITDLSGGTGSPSSAMGGASTDPSGNVLGDGSASAGANYIDNNLGPMDKAMSWMKSLPPTIQAELAKSVLAIPGGIQNQQNKEAELAIQQQKTNQTSYTAIPQWGIINKARA